MDTNASAGSQPGGVRRWLHAQISGIKDAFCALDVLLQHKLQAIA
jgi:hypothetical protein